MNNMQIKMNLFARVSRLAIFTLSVEMTAAASSSFLPDAFTYWFWQSCKHLFKVRVSATNNHFAALVVGNWLYIDGGEIWATWHGSNAAASPVWSASSP
jgi:hypothetical protein